MKQNVEDLAEIMANAQPNDRYYFAIESANVIPHVFRIQKVRLAANEDYDLFVLANDEGICEKVYNLNSYLGFGRPFTLSAKRRAIVHILWDYLNEYNRSMRMPAPFDFTVKQESDSEEDYKAKEEALDTFRYRHLEDIRMY